VSKIKTYLSLNTFVVPSEENMIGSIGIWAGFVQANRWPQVSLVEGAMQVREESEREGFGK